MRPNKIFVTVFIASWESSWSRVKSFLSSEASTPERRQSSLRLEESILQIMSKSGCDELRNSYPCHNTIDDSYVPDLDIFLLWI